MTQVLEWAPLWDAMDAKPEEWIPTTEDMYWQMLECLPPRAQRRGAFLVGEPQRHTSAGAIHACFRQVGTEFSAKYMTVQEFNAL